MKDKNPPTIQTISKNRKVSQRIAVLEALEAGISLFGHEVKSLRSGRVSIDEGVIRIDRGEIFLMNMHIPPYKHISHIEYEPARTRKLLLHKKEIDRLDSQARTKGLALVPLEIYFKKGMVKVTVGLGKGKNTEDRREEIKKRDTDREMRRFRA